MTREEFESKIERTLYTWEDWEKIERVYMRVDGIWGNQQEFVDWYDIHGHASPYIIDRYCDLINEHDRITQEVAVLKDRDNIIQHFVGIN